MLLEREAHIRRREPVLGAAPRRPDPDPPLYPLPRSWRDRLPGPAGSLGLHLAVLLAVLLAWQTPAPVGHPPIPVRVVFEPPPKPKPPQRRMAKPPPSRPPKGRLASEDTGDTDKRDLGPVNSSDLVPGSAPLPLDKPASGLTVPPTLGPEKAVFVPRPAEKPQSLELRPPRRPPHPGRMTMRLAKYPGPAATKSEYLAYLVALTRQHLGLLPLSMVAGRRGETVIGVLVLDNGAIALLKVVRSSGYPDIDARVERMIAAVGRFPPLPQWFQGPSMQLEFRLRFPEALYD
ncbi:MAG TPA: TonB C-terminal domain-containing protein [Stellaceae bacterium]|nr:TonB C-terminal domain-containing protein [Stellaceae bacterium]